MATDSIREGAKRDRCSNRPWHHRKIQIALAQHVEERLDVRLLFSSRQIAEYAKEIWSAPFVPIS